MGKTPLNRLGNAGGIARAVLFLASELSRLCDGSGVGSRQRYVNVRRLYHYGTVKRRSISKG